MKEKGEQTKTDTKEDSFRLIEEAYHRLKTMTFRKNMVPGQRLVGKDLAEMLNMSRTLIINALYSLEREGFVESLPFRGFYVKPVDIQETPELFELREALEVMAIQLAINPMEPSEIDVLEDLAQKHSEYMPNAYDRQKIALGVEFHIQIARMTKNQNLVRLLTVTMEHEYVRYTYDQADPARMKPAVDEHYEIINAIKERDVEKGVQLIRAHVRKNRDHILHRLEMESESDDMMWQNLRANKKRRSSKSPY